MDNKQITAQTPEQIITAESPKGKKPFSHADYRTQREREKAIDAHIEGMTEQDKKNCTLQGEILDCCYKAEEIAKATVFFMENPPEHNFDPIPMVDALFDYIVQINEFVDCMEF